MTYSYCGYCCHGALLLQPPSLQRDLGSFAGTAKFEKKTMFLEKCFLLSPSRVRRKASSNRRLRVSSFATENSLSSILENTTFEGNDYKLPEGEEVSALVRKIPSEPNLEVAVRTVDLVMRRSIRISINTFTALLQRCGQSKDLISGKKVHEQLLENGYKENVLLANMLIDMYGKCGNEAEAQKVFDEISNRNMYSWSGLISAYANKGMVEKAIELCIETRERDNNRPDKLAFIAVLREISEKKDMGLARKAHREITTCGLASDLTVGNALIDMYGKCGDLALANEVLRQLPEQNVGSWNALIGGYAIQNGREKEVFDIFEHMQKQRIEADEDVYVTILQVCGKIKDAERASYFHSHTIGSGYERDLVVGNALIKMYAEIENLQQCFIVFNKMYEHDIVTWNSMITGLVAQGHDNDAIFLYEQMQEEGLEAPDEVTLANAIRACGGVFALDEGLELHHKVISSGFELAVDVANALVWFHASCDRVKDARKVFDDILEKDTVSWNEMVLGYARKAYSHQAFVLFAEMRKEGIVLEKSTCSALLRRCASMGSITLSWGRRIHASIIEFGFNGDALLGNELVFMYSNCGSNIDSQLTRGRMPELI